MSRAFTFAPFLLSEGRSSLLEFVREPRLLGHQFLLLGAFLDGLALEFL